MLKFPKPESRAAEKRSRSGAKLQRWREIVLAVDRRDGFVCRACKRGIAKSTRHHHHMRMRSRGGEDSTANVVLLCAQCHADVHGYRLAIEGDNADGVLRFRWSR
jgi:5-methylcytosine-specific restriction endonuclease McrA